MMIVVTSNGKEEADDEGEEEEEEVDNDHNQIASCEIIKVFFNLNLSLNLIMIISNLFYLFLLPVDKDG